MEAAEVIHIEGRQHLHATKIAQAMRDAGAFGLVTWSEPEITTEKIADRNWSLAVTVDGTTELCRTDFNHNFTRDIRKWRLDNGLAWRALEDDGA